MASRRSSMTSTSSWPAMPARICDRMKRRRLVARVVAGQHHVVGQPRGDGAHQRALGRRRGCRRSRTRTTAGRRGRAATGCSVCSTFSSASGRVRVVDHHLGQPGRLDAHALHAPGHRRPAAARPAAASASDTPSARSAPITTSRLLALKSPISALRSGSTLRRPRAARRPGRRRRSAGRAARSRAGPCVEQVHRSSGARRSVPASSAPCASSMLSTAACRPGQANSARLASQ